MGETIFIDNGATFYEPGKYVIDIKSNIGSEYQYNIIVRSGTKTQSLAPQVFENIREGYAGNDNQVTSTPETGIDSLTTLMIGQRGSADFIEFGMGKRVDMPEHGISDFRTEAL